MSLDIYQKLLQVPFNRVKIEDTFWAPRIRKHKEVTLKKTLEWCEKTGRIANFRKAAGIERGEYEGYVFNDSDVYKILEGVAYSLMIFPDPKLEKYADELIDIIAKAQQEDGYIHPYFTLMKPDKRWTDMMAHEDYSIGHLIEAAIAYYKATNKRKFLDVAIKAADHCVSVFGEGKRHWIPGHQEIELALVKLYKETNNDKYLNLARWFIEERGHGYEFKNEIWDRESFGGPAYNQDDKPVRELSDVKGHAVRAMYYFVAIADIVAVTGDKEYMETLKRVWESVVMRNMYVTGGIGSSKDNEGFIGDYCLPNESAYCETCASVGMVYWNHRMNLLTGEGKYIDILERVLYNGILAGVSIGCDKFFYVNPLASDGTHHRQEWYEVACCPGQIARFMPTIGNYIYAVSPKGIFVNLYISNTAVIPFEGEEIEIVQRTKYPWEGVLKIEVRKSIEKPFEINLRFPGWCRSAEVKVNGEEVKDWEIVEGYIRLYREWKEGDVVEVVLAMPVERVYANPNVEADVGKVAIQRGPIVYCVEEVDNEKNFESIYVTEDTKFIVEYDEELLEGVMKVIGDTGKFKFVAIPYYAWDNRKPGKMKVWIPEVKDSKLPLYSFFRF